MTKRSKFANEPLMYIHQPTVIRPSAPMQHTYRTPKKEDKIESVQKPVKKYPKPTKQRTNISAISKDIVHDLKEAPPNANDLANSAQNTSNKDLTGNSTPAEPSESPIPIEPQDNKDNNEKKKFRDMSILEKVMYFINTPNHLPRMRCEVITEEKKYRGIIKDFQEDHIIMQVGRRMPTTSISIKDVKGIQLIGF
ncbi:CotO family spore coat protein [Ornithinibacillus bavariensis]|uniref:Spore coat protein CotO n=1 Tax=Ornithinibacillus bavariensis TaxID=545502 RepID=A0A919X6I4_9BACI|nr:CotO family spore coat protein [Ornithinibacillus bavariensis]GIO25778.1 hypothetical protein J43TS3_03890 [Ornithinibacillus bavariensis]